MTTLVSGTQPGTGGTAALTDVTTVAPNIEVIEATSLSTTGVFAFSETRPLLTNVESITLVKEIPEISTSSEVKWFQLVADAAGGPAVPATRQLLIK